MPLSGTFDTVGLPELLQWFNSTRKTGTLTVSVDLEDTYLKFRQGDLVAVGTDDPLRLDLGQVLLRTGKINEDQLNGAIGLTGAETTIAQALVQTGLVDEQTLHQTQVEYLLEIVLDLFFQEQGSFHFSGQESSSALLAGADIATENFLSHPLSTQEVLMESMRRIDEWNRIRQVFPNRYVVVQAHRDAQSGPVVDELLALNQPISVGELCLRMGLNKFEVYHQLYRAWEKKQLYLDETVQGPDQKAGQGAARTLLDTARVLMNEKQFDEASEVLSTVSAMEPENPEARQLINELRSGQMTQLYQLIPPHRTLVLNRPREELQEMQLSPREIYLASRLTGKLDVATLVVAVPIGELQTLRILRKLLHANLIAFAD